MISTTAMWYYNDDGEGTTSKRMRRGRGEDIVYYASRSD